MRFSPQLEAPKTKPIKANSFGNDPRQDAEDQGGDGHEDHDRAEQDDDFFEEMARRDLRQLRRLIDDGDRGDQRQ